MDYPSLDINTLMTLATVKEQISANPDYLKNSPYGADIRAAIITLLPIDDQTVVSRTSGPRRGGKGKNEITEDQAAMIEQEAMNLLKELQDLKPGAGKGLDHDTKIAIIKAKTALIEKIIGVQERFYNVRKVSGFMKTVLAILEKLDPDQRSDFGKELEPYL